MNYKKIFVLIFLTSSIAHAQSDAKDNFIIEEKLPFYLGFEGAYAALQDKGVDLTGSMVSAFGGTGTSKQNSGTTIARIFGGYEINENFSLEAGYLQSSNINYATKGTSGSSFGSLSDSISYNLSISGFDYGVIYKPRINNYLDGFFIKGGGTYLTTSGHLAVNLSTTNLGSSTSQTGHGYFAGLGYEYPISKEVNVRASYLYYGNISTDSASNTNVFSLALVVGGKSKNKNGNNSLFSDLSLSNVEKTETVTGNEIGILLSGYTYVEPTLGVSTKGALLGLEYERTQSFNDFFLIGDLIYKQGSLSYSGSGVIDGVSNYYYDMRGLIGKDYSLGNDIIAPFTGLGYRYLYDDNRGLSSSSGIGYRREISYVYLPVGIIHRTKFENSAKLESRIEYDYLIKGVVNSRLSDVAGYGTIKSYTDATNTQTSGWGMRISTSYQKNRWAFTPYFSYWFIQNSNVVSGTKVVGTTTSALRLLEPTNKTHEYGIKASIKF